VFDRVLVRGYDGKDYELTFHIPSSSTTLLVLPGTINIKTIAKLLTGLEKPKKGIIRYEFGKEEKFGSTLYEPGFLDDPYVNIYELLHSLLEAGAANEILRICEGLGFRINKETLNIELPRSLRKLISILYTLHSRGKLSVLIEPFAELDDTMLAILNHEMRRLNNNGKTIVAITNNSVYLRTEFDLYDYAIIINRDGKIVSGDKEKFKGKEILRNTYVYEVRGKQEFIEKIIGIPGLKGFIKLTKNHYWVFVERGYKHLIAQSLHDCLKEKLIIRYRFIGQQKIRG